MALKIGILDSGLGGLSVLKELIQILPNEYYLVYQDSFNNPYGNKSAEVLLKLVDKAVKKLIDYNCKLIVIACNTATIMCMDKLKEKYEKIIFVGIVPAIERACKKGYKNILLLSTENTSKSQYVNNMISKYKKSGQNLINQSGLNLASLIERGSKVEICKLLDELLCEYNGMVDALVLGCTHYSLIKREFKKFFPNADLLDGVYDTCLEVVHQLRINNLFSNNSRMGTITFINTLDDKIINKSIGILKYLE